MSLCLRVLLCLPLILVSLSSTCAPAHTHTTHRPWSVAAGPELAAAVTNAGGLGVIGGVGYTPDFLRQQVCLSLCALCVLCMLCVVCVLCVLCVAYVGRYVRCVFIERVDVPAHVPPLPHQVLCFYRSSR